MTRRNKPRRPSIFSDPNPVPNSLFGEILDWLLAPLLLLWPISIAATYHVAVKIADEAYDPALGERLEQVIQAIRFDEREGTVVHLPAPLPLTQSDLEAGRVAMQVARLDGSLVWGHGEIPMLQFPERGAVEQIRFRDEAMAGEEIRVAYRLLPAGDDAQPLLVQVAENRRLRRVLSSHIISGVLLPQFIIIPLATVFVWFGLTRGLLPLKRLQERIRTRRPEDLSPIDLATVPEELSPMVSAFNDMMTRLAANLEAQQRFIAAAAHQLKTPLAGLKTQSELALAEPDEQNMRQYLQRIASGVDRTTHLANQLLRLARVEASVVRLQPKEEVDLPTLAKDVLVSFVPQAMARRIELGYEGVDRAGIRGHPLLLREMIANLIDNAIKYSDPEGSVTVRVRYTPALALEVVDTGVGVPACERERIFERFYRILGTSEEGSGLGLAIVKEIAENHGASIAVMDNPQGKGTCFRITFASSDKRSLS
ncbi:MAG: sensor histidine kinase N-terminal domain-containing protein [Rhodocyclaceae bacterium]|nr:sensor histidine kinase N-terminal domain-containing protein [Rhodocyclaceae bacterium]